MSNKDKQTSEQRIRDIFARIANIDPYLHYLEDALLFEGDRLFFCSNRMMRLIKENNLKGFKFEVAHIVDE